VIADDAGLLRDALARLLAETGVEVVAQVGDAETLVDAVGEHEPDAAIVDIRMPPTYTHEGAKAAARLREIHPKLGILLLSQSLESRYVADLVRTRPERFGYLLKDRVVDVSVLSDALKTVTSGGTVLDPAVVAHLMGGQGVADQLARLSERERAVLGLMAEGKSNSAIAADLVIDLRTVESHIARIMTKLDLHPTTEEHRRVLAVLAWLRGGGSGG
jgi:DNA-binding NarL/FixJ family response regulator